MHSIHTRARTHAPAPAPPPPHAPALARISARKHTPADTDPVGNTAISARYHQSCPPQTLSPTHRVPQDEKVPSAGSVAPGAGPPLEPDLQRRGSRAAFSTDALVAAAVGTAHARAARAAHHLRSDGAAAAAAAAAVDCSDGARSTAAHAAGDLMRQYHSDPLWMQARGPHPVPMHMW